MSRGTMCRGSFITLCPPTFNRQFVVSRNWSFVAASDSRAFATWPSSTFGN